LAVKWPITGTTQHANASNKGQYTTQIDEDKTKTIHMATGI
jgi:hypothetical protein